MGASPERNRKVNEIIANGTSFLNTESREGDLTIIRSLKISARHAAKEVLAQDPVNNEGRAVITRFDPRG